MKKLCNPIKNNIFKFCDLVLNKATPELFLMNSREDGLSHNNTGAGVDDKGIQNISEM